MLNLAQELAHLSSDGEMRSLSVPSGPLEGSSHYFWLVFLHFSAWFCLHCGSQDLTCLC